MNIIKLPRLLRQWNLLAYKQSRPTTALATLLIGHQCNCTGKVLVYNSTQPIINAIPIIVLHILATIHLRSALIGTMVLSLENRFDWFYQFFNRVALVLVEPRSLEGDRIRVHMYTHYGSD